MVLNLKEKKKTKRELRKMKKEDEIYFHFNQPGHEHSNSKDHIDLKYSGKGYILHLSECLY